MLEKNQNPNPQRFWDERVTEDKWEAPDEPVIILRAPAAVAENSARAPKSRAPLAVPPAQGLALYEPYGFVTFLNKITRDL